MAPFACCACRKLHHPTSRRFDSVLRYSLIFVVCWPLVVFVDVVYRIMWFIGGSIFITICGGSLVVGQIFIGAIGACFCGVVYFGLKDD